MEAAPVAQPMSQIKPKSASTYEKHLTRTPNIHQSQASNSALAILPYPRKQNPTSPVRKTPTSWPIMPCFQMTLLTFHKTHSCPKSLGKSVPLLVRHCTLPIHGLFTLE